MMEKRWLRRYPDGQIYPYTEALDSRRDFALCTASGKTLEPYEPKKPSKVKHDQQQAKVVEALAGLSSAKLDQVLAAIASVAGAAPVAGDNPAAVLPDVPAAVVPPVTHDLTPTPLPELSPAPELTPLPDATSLSDERLMADLPDDKQALIALADSEYGIPLSPKMSMDNMKRQIVESMKSHQDAT